MRCKEPNWNTARYHSGATVVYYYSWLLIYSYPLNIEELFCLEAIIPHYMALKDKYDTSTSRTVNKSILLPNILKKVAHKSWIVTIKLYNRLPKELQLIRDNNKYLKNKLKPCIVKIV